MRSSFAFPFYLANYFSVPLTPALSSAPSPSGTRPGSRASKTLRFAELTADDVHVYESAPPSPRKKALALPPPSAEDVDTVSLGKWKGSHTAVDGDSTEPERELEEGTPEYIRRRFFPSAPAHHPDLAWMEEPEPSLSLRPVSEALRFDLSGNPLLIALHSSLPTHLGLHHHAPDSDGVQRAGYTLDDVFMMSRSGVKAQRAAGMRMLVGVARWIGGVQRRDEVAVEGVMKPSEIAELKGRIVAAGVDAMGERGSLGAHAVEVVSECVVGWPEGEEALHVDTDSDLAGVELGNIDSSLPLAHILPKIVVALSTQSESFHSSESSPSRSLGLLLGILHRLSRQTNDIATEIVSTPSLVPSIFRCFLLTDSSSSSADSCLALEILTTLSTSTRANAQALMPPADALLRFITTLPPPDTELLTATLKFYTTLATYGLYSHIASTAHLQFSAMGQYVLQQSQDRRLMSAWAGLLEAWIVCATDPHQTTPDHDILWSQIVAWGWGQDVLELRKRLSVDLQDLTVWVAIWRAEVAWLEGARINGVKNGETEREECLSAIKKGFDEEGGRENDVIKSALSALSSAVKDFGRGGSAELQGIGSCADTLTSAIRLWLACSPPASDGSLASPPFSLPFSQLSDLCAKLVTHPLWSRLISSGSGYALFRPLVGLLSSYIRLSKRMPDVSQDVWMAQALAILSRLLPGDEEFALEVAGDILSLITPQWVQSRSMNVPPSVWDKGGLSVIKPFLSGTIRPRHDVHIGPSRISPYSIKHATTQRLPPNPSAFSRDYGLPLPRDWTFSPLDHLLRSGTSPVFNALPPSWDASEVDVTRATLLFTKISREVTSRFSFVDFVLTREEVIFGCMKVFMLEHDQPHNDSTEEVFRDRLIEQLMIDLLTPFTAASAQSVLPSSPVVPSPPAQGDLEQVAVKFLSASTPFYQYYTDFLALYDAISFSHPTFARLLLPPTSMRYAPDYRRHLWNDFGHVLKSIRTSPSDIISADLGEYMWPIETDAHMISAYLRSLVKIPLQGFLRLLAVHHIACNIWPDLRETSTESAALAEDRAAKLLKAIVDQASIEVVRDVLLYQQARGQPVAKPPRCFQLDGESKVTRLEYIRRVGDDKAFRQVESLLR